MHLGIQNQLYIAVELERNLSNKRKVKLVISQRPEEFLRYSAELLPAVTAEGNASLLKRMDSVVEIFPLLLVTKR